MNAQPPTCSGCPLYDDHVAQGFMRPEGTGSNGVLVIADILDERGAQEGLPLRPKSPSGSVFSGIVRRMQGVDRSNFLLSNTIWCRPGKTNWITGAPYEFPAIEHCQQYNEKLVRERRPRAIVTLGTIPTRTITGLSGHNQGIKLVRGFIIPSSRPEYIINGVPIPVIPTFDPYFLLRASKTRKKGPESPKGEGGKVEKAEGGMALSGVVRRDLELAINVAKVGWKPLEFESITATRDMMDRLVYEVEHNPDLPIAWDIETPRSLANADDESEIDSIQAQVLQIQFALDAKQGYVFPGFDIDWVKEGTRRILATRNVKYTWNGWKFDNKVVQGHHGIPILGVDIDLMSAWKWIQPDLPRGLQFATSFHAPNMSPWKHRNQTGDDIYGASDVISLHLNAAGIFSVMDQRGLRTSYDRHVLLLRNELVAASHRGVPLDPERHEEFGTKTKKTRDGLAEEINTLIPEAILGLEPKRKPKGSSVTEFGYIRRPKQLEPFLDNDSGTPLDGSDFVVITELVPELDEDGEPTGDMEEKRITYVQRVVRSFNKTTQEFEDVKRWGRRIPFSVGSPDQKIAYIKYRREEEIAARVAKGQLRAFAEQKAKYKVPQVRNKQKEMKNNTGSKELEKLFKATGDPVFKLLVEISKVNKLYSTYYKGWQVKRKGKLVSPEYVHTTFGVADTGTGQLSSVEPNVQNAPKHSDLAKDFRFGIAAKPGKILLEFDKKAFHAQTLAFEAKDKAYARLSAIDVHSYMTAFRLGLPEAPKLMSWSDKDLIGWMNERKADEKTLYLSEAVPNYPNGMTFQQVRDYKSKRVILGIGFAQGALSIFEQNPESYNNKREVQQFLDIFAATFPGIKKFQKEITQLAHKQERLISRWGYIRRFYDVFQWNPNAWNEQSGTEGDWGHGDDFEAAVAFLPANDAFGMFKEEMLRLAGYRVQDVVVQDYYMQRPWREYVAAKKIWPERISENLLDRYGFINNIHDALMFHCDYSLKDKCIEDVLTVMREPCLTLTDPEMAPSGLFVDAECMVGPDWSNMKKLKGV